MSFLAPDTAAEVTLSGRNFLVVMLCHQPGTKRPLRLLLIHWVFCWLVCFVSSLSLVEKPTRGI